MEYEELLGIVEQFCNDGQNVPTKVFTLGADECELVYVKNGDQDYRSVLDKLFSSNDVFREYQSDFVLFRCNGDYFAAGTYTLGSAAIQEDEVAELTKVILNEMVLAKWLR